MPPSRRAPVHVRHCPKSLSEHGRRGPSCDFKRPRGDMAAPIAEAQPRPGRSGAPPLQHRTTARRRSFLNYKLRGHFPHPKIWPTLPVQGTSMAQGLAEELAPRPPWHGTFLCLHPEERRGPGHRLKPKTKVPPTEPAASTSSRGGFQQGAGHG